MNIKPEVHQVSNDPDPTCTKVGQFIISHAGSQVWSITYDKAKDDILADRKIECIMAFSQDIIKMRELLHAVNESTGPGANPQALRDAHWAVFEYLESKK